ncbi:MAG: hypothetical protein ACOC2T_02825 [Planctomycetota bacterium]
MKQFLYAALCGMFVLGHLTSAAIAQEEEDAEEPEEKSVRRMQVKRYLGVDTTVVVRAIARGYTRNVRFEDTFKAAARPSSNVRTIRTKSDRHRIGLMFRTDNNIVGLVPRDLEDTIEELQEMREGRKLTIEGTTVGKHGSMRCVLVDVIMAGEDKQSSIEHEVEVRWPRSRDVDPQTVEEPGNYTIEFPCRYEEDETEKGRLTIKSWDKDEFMEEYGEEIEDEEIGPREDKNYDRFDATSVYRHIRNGDVMHVEFDDEIGKLEDPPDKITLPNDQKMRVGSAFRTRKGITCIVPTIYEDVVNLADQVIPGQEARIWGTTLPPKTFRRAMVVDKMELPGTSKPAESSKVWDVTLEWGDETARFFDIGTYTFDFPCQNTENRVERLEIDLKEVRVIEEEDDDEEEDEED